MAKKTLEARLRMIDETSQGARSAAASAQAVTTAYSNLDKAARKAQLRILDERDVASRTIQRQKITNLEREVALGREGAKVELDQARATAAHRKEREALINITRSDVTTFRQKVAAYRELERAEKLHAQRMKQIATPSPAARGGGILAGAAGRLAPLAAGYVGTQAINELLGRIDRSVDARVGFEKTLLELFAVGDNSKNIDLLRGKVIDFSAATGKTREEVANFFTFVDQGMADASDEMREKVKRVVLMMSRGTNADLATMGEAMIKTWRSFGHELGTIENLADKMFKTVEIGFLSHQEMAQHSVRVIQAGKAMGFNIDQVLGVYAAATNVAKDAQVASTAIANSMLKFQDAAKAGVHLSGDLLNQLEQLSKVDPNLLTKIFDVRNVTVLRGVVDQLDLVKTSIDGVAKSSGDLGNKLGRIGENFTASITKISADLKTMQDNQLLMLTGSPERARTLALREAARTFVKSTDVGEALPEALQNRLADLSLVTDLDKAARVLINQAELRAKAGDITGARQSFDLANSTGTVPAEIVDAWRKFFSDDLQRRAGNVSTQNAADRANAGLRSSARTMVGLELQEYIAQRAERGFTDKHDQAAVAEIMAKAMLDPMGETYRADILRKAGIAPDDKKAAEKYLKENGFEGRLSALERAQTLTEQARANNRSVAEQLQVMRAPEMLERSGWLKSMLKSIGQADIAGMHKTMFGEGPRTLIDQLLGRDKKQGTLLPVLGEWMKGKAAQILGEENAGFLGIGSGKSGRRARDTDAAELAEYNRVAPLHLSNSGYSAEAERVKRQAEMQKDIAAIKQNTDAAIDAMMAIVKAATGVRVLSFNPDS